MSGTIVDQIRAQIDATVMRPTTTWKALQLIDALRAVLDVHTPFRVYDECGHYHEYPETGEVPEGLVAIDGGLACEAGYQHTVCRECCCDDDCFVREDCVDNHEHEGEYACWPCSTLRAVAAAIDVGTEQPSDTSALRSATPPGAEL